MLDAPGAAPDPFVDILGTLGTSASKIALLLPPVDLSLTVVTDIDAILHDIDSFFDAFDLISGAVTAIEAAVHVLDAVPGLGEVTEVADDVVSAAKEAIDTLRQVFGQLKTDILDPVMHVLDDVKTGLADIRTVVQVAGQRIPQYLNTIQILDYLAEVAGPLTDVLKGSDAADRLGAILTHLDDVKRAVATALKPFAEALKAIETAVGFFAHTVKEAVDALGGPSGAAMTALHDVNALLKPVEHAFHRVVHVIKPLKWALDAIHWVEKHVLKPAVDKILKATGLSHLLDGLEHTVEEKLGIAPLVDMVRGHVSSGDMRTNGASTGKAGARDLSGNWGGLGDALSGYRGSHDEVLRTGVEGLVTAVVGTAIDPDKPSQIPDWPDPPPLRQTGAAASGFLARNSALAVQFARVARIGSTAAPRPPLRLAVLLAAGDDLPPVDAATWPQASAVLTTIGTSSDHLAALQTAAATLETRLAAFDASLALPATFSDQVSDLATLFGTSADLLTLIARFDLFDAVLTPLRTIVQHQRGELTAVTGALPGLQKAVAAMDQAARPVIAAAPAGSAIEEAIGRLDGWAVGIHQLVGLVTQGRAADATAGGKLAPRFDALAAQIEAASQDLSKRLGAVDAEAAGLATAIGGMNDALGAYAGALGALSAHSTLIGTKALPSLDHAAGILGTIDSIFDPLSALLDQMHCVDAGDTMKSGAAAAVAAMKARANDGSAPGLQTLAALFDQVADRALPLGQLAQAVADATSTIGDTAVERFQASAKPLPDRLSGLAAALAETRSYEAPGKDGTREAVANDLVDQVLADAAQALFRDLAAGLPPEPA